MIPSPAGGYPSNAIIGKDDPVFDQEVFSRLNRLFHRLVYTLSILWMK